MQVLIETIQDGVRATALLPWKVVAEGATESLALAELRAEFARKIPAGARVVELTEPTSSSGNPWMAFAGDMKDDPLYDSWQESIAEYRQQQADSEEEVPLKVA